MGSISYFNLSKYINTYKSKLFFETGTLYGYGIDYALTFPFKKIFSVEIMPELAAAAKVKYKDKYNVEIIEGHSGDILKEYTDKLTENTIFWLDAHFPGADAGFCSYKAEKDINKRTPLKLELECIQKRSFSYKDVIIIDDLRCYEDSPHLYSTFNAHMEALGQRGEGCTREELIGSDGRFIYEMFEKTHNIEKNYSNEGYYILTPK